MVMRALELIENANGVAVYAYDLHDFCIYNVRMTECGRFEVDPCEYYGLTPEEVAAIDKANEGRDIS
jgi:hypothetical protein